MNYYEVLQVSKGATVKEIKRAYRKMTAIYHPDREDTGNEEKFMQITEAYEALTNSDFRKVYDQSNCKEIYSHSKDYSKYVKKEKVVGKAKGRTTSAHVFTTDEQLQKGGRVTAQLSVTYDETQKTVDVNIPEDFGSCVMVVKNAGEVISENIEENGDLIVRVARNLESTEATFKGDFVEIPYLQVRSKNGEISPKILKRETAVNTTPHLLVVENPDRKGHQVMLGVNYGF